MTAPRAHETLTHSEALVTTVTGEELERTGQRSLPQAIEAAAGGGLWLQETNLGGGSPFLRGLTGNRILLIVDGVRVNDGTTRLGPNQSLNGFDPAIVDRVEILRGPASVLYGSDAIGGVILVWTKRAGRTEDGDRIDIDSGLSTRVDSAVDGGSLTFDGTLRTPDYGIFTVGSLYDFNDVEAPEGTIPFTGYRGRSFFSSFDHDFGEGRDLRITTSLHKDIGVPRTDRLIVGFGQTTPSNAVFDFTRQDRRRFVVTYTDRNPLEFLPSEETQMRFSYRTYTETREKQSTGSSTYTFERDDTQTFGLGIDFKTVVGDDHLVTYGLDFEVDEVDAIRRDLDLPSGVSTPTDGAFAPNARYLRSGVFVQDETSLGAYDATVGARYSSYNFSFDGFGGGPHEDGSFDSFTASAQLARQLTDDVRATGTLAQGFRAPNLDDLANMGSFAGGTELNNPDLDPEQSLTAELAVDGGRGGFGAGAAVFFTRITDTIGRELIDLGDPVVTGDETYLRQNVGEVELYGAEASLRHPLGDSGLSGVYSVTLTRGRQFDDVLDPGDGRTDARRIPPLFGRAALEYRPLESLLELDWVDLELLWADNQDNLNPQDVSDPRVDPNGTPGWGVVNLDFGGALGERSEFSWNAGLHNAFDKEYRVHASGFDAPGRSLVFGVDWRP